MHGLNIPGSGVGVHGHERAGGDRGERQGTARKQGREEFLDEQGSMRERRARLAGLEPATTGLEGRCSIQLSYRRGFAGRPVGAPGFEPGTSCSQSRRATGLRHAPKSRDVQHSCPKMALVATRQPDRFYPDYSSDLANPSLECRPREILHRQAHQRADPPAQHIQCARERRRASSPRRPAPPPGPACPSAR